VSQPTVLKRSEIAQQYKWNAESIFPTPEAWQEEAEKLKEILPQMDQYRGRLGESPAVLSQALQLYNDIYKRFGKFIIYGMVGHEVDTTDQDATRRSGLAMGMYGRFAAAGAFLNPELLAIGEDTLKKWMEQEPSLKVYAHSFEDLFRQQAHVRSAEVEELLGGLATPFRGASTTASMMTDADFRFEPATGTDGKKIPVTQGTLDEILASPDREARRTAWESYMDTFLAHKNSLASNLSTSMQQNVFMAHARHYHSTLEASLFENNIPVEVFHNLVDTFRAHLPTWHRYWAIRRKALKVDELHPYDIWAPLTETRPVIPYEQAVEWICAGLKPMGEAYVNTIRKGCLEDRWVDVYPNLGKSSSQFSTGWPGTFPFIVLNFDNTIFSLSTLAHELGHSMHSYLTWQNQPVVYSSYSLFAAEVASNFHQAMVRGYLLESNPDPVFQINVIEEAMSNFHRYFFIMPTLARFELEMHEKAEHGEGLTADDMNQRMAELFAEGYGSEVHVDTDRVGITWATFGHLYMDYYVYQYTTGISGANALAAGILKGEPGAVDRYLGFLKAGSSVYPLQALQQAGVDLATPQPIEAAFAVLDRLVDRLEKLVS
jgi:oligoendopeptidase F